MKTTRLKLGELVKQKESVYWGVFQRLLEEEFTEDLLAVLGHLVLLRFTRGENMSCHSFASRRCKVCSAVTPSLRSGAHTPAMVLKGQNDRVL